MKKLLFLFLFLSLLTFKGYSSTTGGICDSLTPFCTGQQYSVTNTNNHIGVIGPNYGCVGIGILTVYSAWYYFQIGTSGTFQMSLSQTTGINGTGTYLPCSYVLWGPFQNMTTACDSVMNGLTNGVAPIQSYWSTTAIPDTIGLGVQGGSSFGLPGCIGQTTPPAAVTGQYYILALINNDTISGYFNFNQIGGTATTNCAIVCNTVVTDSIGPLCNGDTVHLHATNVDTTNAVAFGWTGPNGFSVVSDSNAITPSLTTAGTYNYTFYIIRHGINEELDTCAKTTTVTVLPLPRSTRNKQICEGESFEGHNSSLTYYDTFQNAKGCDSIRTTNLTVVPLDTVSVFLKYCNTDLPIYWNSVLIPAGTKSTDSFGRYTTPSLITGCDSTTYLNLEIDSLSVTLLSSADTIVAGMPVTLNTVGNTGFRMVSWTPTSLFPEQMWMQQTIYPDQTYIYEVTGTNDVCTDTGVKQVVVIPFNNKLGLPNAFSPNGDGVNDEFRISIGNKQVKAVALKVFNRYGQLVFSTNYTQQAKWDGTKDGKECAGGTYFYVADILYVNDQKETIKGDVTLLR